MGIATVKTINSYIKGSCITAEGHQHVDEKCGTPQELEGAKEITRSPSPLVNILLAPSPLFIYGSLIRLKDLASGEMHLK